MPVFFYIRYANLLLNTLTVAAVASVNLDALASVDKQRNHNGGAGLNGCRFHCVGGGVALNARLGVSHLKLNVWRHFSLQRLLGLGVESDVNQLTFFHKVVIFNQIAFDVDLVVSLGVHKHEAVALAVKVLILTAFDADGLNLVVAVENVLDSFAVLKILEFGADESGALARFYVKKIHNCVEFAIEFDAQAIPQI